MTSDVWPGRGVNPRLDSFCTSNVAIKLPFMAEVRVRCSSGTYLNAGSFGPKWERGRAELESRGALVSRGRDKEHELRRGVECFAIWMGSHLLLLNTSQSCVGDGWAGPFIMCLCAVEADDP